MGTKGYDATYGRRLGHRREKPKGITRGGFFTNCANHGATLTTCTVANARVVTKESAVKCAVKGSPVVDETFRAKGVADLYLHSGATMIATAHVTPTSVRLTVPKSCTLMAPPKP